MAIPSVGSLINSCSNRHEQEQEEGEEGEEGAWRRSFLGKGAAIEDVRKIFRFFVIPSPHVTVTNQLILFLSSAFWGPPSPHAHPLRTSYLEAPKRERCTVLDLLPFNILPNSMPCSKI